MPPGDLNVDLTGLSDYATQLDSIKRRLMDTGKADRVLGDAGLSHPGATGALHDFIDGWRDGRKEIEGGLNSVTEMARAVVDEFTKTDNKLASESPGHSTETV